MDSLDIFGYFATLLIGLSLGLIGSGGSILTIPVLVYLFGIDTISSTSYSLVFVGGTALIGAVRKHMNKEVDWKVAISFGAPAIAAVYLTRRFVLPAFPHAIEISDWIVQRDLIILVFFAMLMLLAALSMLIQKKSTAESDVQKGPSKNPLLIVLEGLFTGFVTGLVGAGGGFLIIPALVVLGKLPMKIAVGTSLAIISMKSLIGFLGDYGNSDIHIDFAFLALLIVLSGIGMLAGIALSKRIDGSKLKKAFAWFVLAMAVFMLFKELT
jgi:uncharacterized membrane protein YfcA